MTNEIHAIWLGDTMSPMSQACIDDWVKQGYSYRLWTENDPEIKEWIEKSQFAKECYKRKLHAFVVDYLRLKVLEHSGGLYLDTDVTIQKDPFPLFEGCDFAAGYELEEMLGNAVIFAQKDSLLLKKLIQFYENSDEVMTSNLFMGPHILTHFYNAQSSEDKERCKVFDIEVFYGYSANSSVYHKSPEAVLTHWFQYSWKDNKGKVFLKSKHMGLLGKLYVWQKYFLRFGKKK